MPPVRTVGPKGVNGSERVDSGTLARNFTASPGFTSSVANGKEGVSWTEAITRKQAYADTTGLTVGEIYFATNEDQVDTDDIFALEKLIASLETLLQNGFKFKLLCVGGADYRASFDYNMKLGMRRALSVKNAIDGKVSSKGLTVDVSSIGESGALQPKAGKKPSLLAIMDDRKVSIVINSKGLIR